MGGEGDRRPAFYIARTDALSEISRILKLGRVRVHFASYVKADGAAFHQKLDLRNGLIDLDRKGLSLELFVDSATNVIHVSGGCAGVVTATLEDWRTSARTLPKEEQGSAWSVHDAPFPLVESADVLEARGSQTVWYHRNETSVVPELWKNQSLTNLPGTFDPLISRTFGGLMTLDQRGDGFELKVATYAAQTDTVQTWREGVEREAAQSQLWAAGERTRAWWHRFWDRSWVFAGGPKGDEITRGYVLQRYVQACQGRGKYPIKFNGGYYTVEPKAMGKPFNADFRNWGDSHWWQNVRHMYHPMLASGDFEMMDPLWRLYESARPLAESRSRKYHGAEGAYFPETMTVFGTYSGGDYGWDRTGHRPDEVLCPWWQYAWNQGPELVALMLDRWDYTRDQAFLKRRVLPMAVSVLRYFDTRFKKDAGGRIVLDPTQAVETYWEGVVNDMPSTAGLFATTDRLCALPSSLVSAQDAAFFKRMWAACPVLPIREIEGQPALSPAQKYVPKTSNVENPELYAVWPFRLVSLARPALLEAGKRAYQHRLNHLDVGWGYDGNVAALLGLTDESARILAVKCANSNPAYRWPATWGPNFDWLPDQNHGGNLLNTANLMLLQAEPLEAGGAIRILPAWPVGWDVDFKLHAPGNTTVHCVAKGGQIVSLEVAPATRLRDVSWPAAWRR